MYKPGKTGSARVEVRSIDSGANPYLTYAVLLAAGLKGIEEGYELPPGAEDDVWALSDAERRALGIEPLPQNLGEALALMERSDLVAETLGEHVFDFFLRNKKQEWEEYRSKSPPSSCARTCPCCKRRSEQVPYGFSGWGRRSRTGGPSASRWLLAVS
ncbi:hypothetical protein SHKM778_73280 [Streptomyces sp. KM77-8]|uniref:GS catalytic domain-containing protein n=1 Tax=Streptomyces haneummycinicus TaxID=3074435 RepID=A0AAT9HTG1_9ACTN